MKNKRFYFFLGIIFFIAFFLRFYRLGEIPFGFYQDESAIGYNAYSIIETGRDEYGESLPLYFKSFGDYKLPVYIYSTILPIKFFGLNEFAVRFPSAFFGFLSVFVFYFFLREITKDKNLSIAATGLFAINPWLLHYNRATFEVSISLFLFLLGSLLIYRSFNKHFSGLFLLGTLCFIFSLYSYNLTRLLAPALYFLIVFLNREKIKNLGKGELIKVFVASIIILLPFLSSFFQSGGVSSASGTLIFSSASVRAPVIELRSYLVDLPTFVSKPFFNNFILIFWKYIENIVSYFSATFFFVSGSTHGNHGIGNIGQLYLFEFVLLVVGIVKIVREKTKWSTFILLWSLVVIFAASLTRDVPHATRSFFLIVPLEVLSAVGFLEVLKWIKNIKINHLKLLLAGFFSLVIIYNLIYYFASYYIHFPILYAKSWRLEDKALSFYIKQNEQKYDRIIFDRNAGFIYTSLLFYLKYPPSEFQKTVTREPDDSEGFSEVKSFGKYEFKDIDWLAYQNLNKRILFVTSEDKKPQNIPVLTTFHYPRRPVVIAVKQKMLSYPVEEAAYVLVEKK